MKCYDYVMAHTVDCVTPLHWEKLYSISFHIKWDMIVVTVFLSILNQMEFHLVQNRNITEKKLTIVNLFSVMFRYEDFWIITLIILLTVYILGKAKHLIYKFKIKSWGKQT